MVTFGAISKAVTRVEFQPADGRPSIPGKMVPLPPCLPFAFDRVRPAEGTHLAQELLRDDRKVCAIALPPAGSGTLEFVDASGAVLFEQGIG